MSEMTRRAWLQTAAAAAAMAAGMGRLRQALAADAVPEGMARVRGDVRIGGAVAKRGMAVRPGNVVTVGRGGEAVFVVGRDAFMARSSTRVVLSAGAGSGVPAGLRLVTGALLSVFEPGREQRIRTVTAAIGIRGTGIYVEAEEKRTYACTCYGEVELVPVADPKAAEVVRTMHHEQPRYIYAKGMPRMMETAPVINHTDAELILLESLVGRQVPFDPKSYP